VAAWSAALVFFCAALSVAERPTIAAPAETDPKAAAVARALTDAMGGQAAWDTLPFLRFDFVVAHDGREVARFRHWWDRKQGRCRVEGPDDQGRIVTALFRLSDRRGKTFTDGIADTDSANIADIIRVGYERWVSDTRWLLIPFTLGDPGTRVKHSGVKRGMGGAEWDVLEVTSDPAAGSGPKDSYWLYVNRKSHLLDRWEFVLQGANGPRQGSTWEEWIKVGPLRLSTLRRLGDPLALVRLENVSAPATLDESVFTYARPRE
jgi:hypothetical protein